MGDDNVRVQPGFRQAAAFLGSTQATVNKPSSALRPLDGRLSGSTRIAVRLAFQQGRGRTKSPDATIESRLTKWIVSMHTSAVGSSRGVGGRGYFLGVMCHAARAAPAKSSVVPAEVALGERLFLETRFSEPFFARHRGGDGALNPATANNPSLTQSGSTPAISCRTCHLVDEFRNAHAGGVRSYTDFAQRSPIPSREDGLSTTARNSPTLVDATLPRDGPMLLHFDGEFASAEELVRGTLTGRNFGWLATEQALAIAHIAAVIRDDDGEGDLARLYGGIPYRVALAGTAPSLPAEFRLPPKFRLDPARSTDRQILDAIGRLMAAYMDSLRFSRDASGDYSGSPYDLFVARNRLPKRPAPNENELDYAAACECWSDNWAPHTTCRILTAGSGFTSRTSNLVRSSLPD